MCGEMTFFYNINRWWHLHTSCSLQPQHDKYCLFEFAHVIFDFMQQLYWVPARIHRSIMTHTAFVRQMHYCLHDLFWMRFLCYTLQTKSLEMSRICFEIVVAAAISWLNSTKTNDASTSLYLYGIWRIICIILL